MGSWLVLMVGLVAAGAGWRLLADQFGGGQGGAVPAATTTGGRVVRVEPMQREVNRAAGHPLTVEFSDQGGNRRQVRDISGVGGYLLREGAEVTVQFPADHPAKARIVAAASATGSYPVPGRPAPSDASWPRLLVRGGIAVVAVAWIYFVFGVPALEPAGLASIVFTLAGAGLLAQGGYRLAGWLSRRRGTWREATGVITDSWEAETNLRQTLTPSEFTVYFATDDQREVHTVCPVVSSLFRSWPGRPVRVRYHPARPTQFEIRELRFVAMASGTMKAVIGVAALLAGGYIGTLPG